MDTLLGQPARLVHCTRYTGLTDELTRLTQDTHVKAVVISSLTGIVVGLTGASETSQAIEKAFGTLASVIKDVVLSNTGMRIFIARCTPRGLPGFSDYAMQALVGHSFVSELREKDSTYLLFSATVDNNTERV